MPRLNANLLIVDDDPSTRLSLTQIFTALGHRVRSSEDGFSALAEIRREIPDILLSDLNMPGMSGFELLSVVRRRFPAIRVIAMSGAFSGNSFQPGVAADAFYQKGVKLDNLLKTVDSVAASAPRLRVAGATAPIWISRSQRCLSGEAYVAIACPECLRTFPQDDDETLSAIKQTVCAYCSSVIHYAIVQPSDPAAPQLYQHKSAVAS